jgi:hypothetical protein
VAGEVELRVTFIVFERDQLSGHIEDKGAEGAVVVLPAEVDFEIIPGERFDRGFEVQFRQRIRSQVNDGPRIKPCKRSDIGRRAGVPSLRVR